MFYTAIRSGQFFDGEYISASNMRLFLLANRRERTRSEIHQILESLRSHRPPNAIKVAFFNWLSPGGTPDRSTLSNFYDNQLEITS